MTTTSLAERAREFLDDDARKRMMRCGGSPTDRLTALLESVAASARVEEREECAQEADAEHRICTRQYTATKKQIHLGGMSISAQIAARIRRRGDHTPAPRQTLERPSLEEAQDFLRERAKQIANGMCTTCGGQGKFTSYANMSGTEFDTECPTCHGTGRQTSEKGGGE